MNKENVYEAFFDTMKEALEWAREGDETFSHYVDGAVDMCVSLFEVLDKKEVQED